MAKRVSSMAELTKQINALVKETLNNPNSLTAEEIKRTESDMVEQEVYNRYGPDSDEPWVYQRRGDNGGLADVGNMWHEAVESRGKVSMLIMNLTPPNPEFNDNDLKTGQVAMLVEGGHGSRGLRYSSTKNRSGDAGKYLAPRSFQQKTIETLRNNKMHIQTLAFELRQKGLDTKLM